MCAKILPFVQKLGAGRYSVKGRTYEFFVTKAANRGRACGNRYSTCMVNECKKVGDTATQVSPATRSTSSPGTVSSSE